MYQIGNVEKLHEKDMERKLIFVRLAACSLFVFLVNATTHFDNVRVSNIASFIYIIINILILFYNSSRQDPRLFMVSIFGDLIMITILIALGNGIESDIYITYFVLLAYIISRKQKHLIFFATLLITIVYPVITIVFSDLQSYSLSAIATKLILRIFVIWIAVFVLFEIRVRLNYSDMLRQKAYEMALIDPLTKVYNRNMLETLEQYRKTAPYNISFAMIDIDDFKSINDKYGHQKGDKILSMLGELIKKNIRTDDICIRYGGEEFLLAFANTDDEIALRILERIKSAFSEYIFDSDGQSMYCTISAGLAFGSDKEASEIIISHADNALYQAKRSGKNNIVTYCNASLN